MADITTVGTILINDALPEDMRKKEHRLDKKGVHKLFMELAKKHPEEYSAVLQELSNVGKTAAWTEGLSVSLAALRRSKAKEEILRPVREKIKSIIDDDNLDDEERNQAIVSELVSVSEKLTDAVYEESKAEGSPFAVQIESGARGKKSNLASLRGADLLSTDQNDNFIPVPIWNSYAEGLTPAQYFAASYGQRKGMLNVKLATADSGFLAKQLVNAAHRQVVTRDEPEATRLPVGLPTRTDDKDNIGAVLAQDVGKYKAGTILDDETLEDLQDEGIEDILVHSIMTEPSADGGVSAQAAGHRTREGLHQLGDNIGIPAAQAIGERLSQGALSCLVEGTLVRMADWTTKCIEDVEVGDWVLGADMTGQTFPVKVTNTFDNGVQEAYRTVFRHRKRQRALESTLRHKVLVRTYFTGHSEEVYNDKPRKLPIGKRNRDMKCVAPIGYSSRGRPQVREGLAYLIGALLGDGCYTESVQGVHFSCADPVYIQRFGEWMAAHNLRLKHLNRYHYRVSQLEKVAHAVGDDGRYVSGALYNPARQVLAKYGMEGKYAHEKTLPSDVMNWDNRSISELIAGLIDTDGSLFARGSSKQPTLAISYSSASQELCEGVRDLLEQRFGIYPAAIHCHPPGVTGAFYAKHAQYSFAITDKESVARFVEHIAPHLLGCKREKVEEYHKPETLGSAHAGNYKRVEQVSIGLRQVYDIEVDHPDHLFVLANGLIVSNSKHTAGVSDRISKSGFEYINRLIQAPESFPEAGPLSEEDGTVEDVREAPQGGNYVRIKKKEYYVPPGLNVTVKVGDEVEQGDDISDGTPHPGDLVRLRGIGEARRVYMQNLKEALDASGVDTHRRNVESVAAGLINWARVTDPDGIDQHIYDDVVPFNNLAYNYKPRQDAEELEPKKLVGRYLEEPVLHYTPGTRVTKKIAKELEKWKIKRAYGHQEPPEFEPHMVRGLHSIFHDPDWKTRLSGFYTSSAFQKALHRGRESDVRSTSYVPSLTTPQTLGRQLKTLGKYGQQR